MLTFNAYSSVLVSIASGLLLTCASAQAQTTATTLVLSTDGSTSFVATSEMREAPAASRATLHLSQPPAPEATASFYDGSHKDLHQSLAWMQETNAVAPTYWNLYTEARIRLQLHDYAGARATAEQAYQLALKAMPASQQYVLLSAAVVAKTHELAKR